MEDLEGKYAFALLLEPQKLNHKLYLGEYEIISLSTVPSEISQHNEMPVHHFKFETNVSKTNPTRKLTRKSVASHQPKMIDLDVEQSTRKAKLSVVQNLKVREQRNLDMEDSNVGWLPASEETAVVEETVDEITNENEWFDILNEHTDELKTTEEQTLINFGVLWAIIDFVFD